MKQWHRETSPLLELPSGENRTIFVIGAYSGTVAGMLIEQHPTYEHHLFEPQDWACDQLREKFSDLGNVHVHQFGLGDRSGTFQMAMRGAYDCTFMQAAVPFGDDSKFDAKLVEFGEFVESRGIDNLYYATLNIEAYEYVLLPHMARIGWLERCQVLGLSWHDDSLFGSPVPGPYTWLGEAAPHYAEMQALLAKTHDLHLEIENWQTWQRRLR